MEDMGTGNMGTGNMGTGNMDMGNTKRPHNNFITIRIMKPLKKYLVPALLGLLAMSTPDCGVAAPLYRANIHAKTLTTPAGEGAANNIVFIGVGGTMPAPYANDNDGAAVVGFGIGDPKENLGLQVCLVSLDLSQWDRYSMALHLHRDLGNANSFGIGVENIMLTGGGDSGKSYYAVYSQSVQAEPFVNAATGVSRLHFSVGAGNGRFGDKSGLDIANGKGEHGTYVFGNVAYEVADQFNVIADWNGTNLNAGVAKTFMIDKLPIVTAVGAGDLTDNSGDGVRFLFIVGTGFKL
jgi:hypothetical protein